MKKTIVVALILGLIAGSFALPADAKKKKKKLVSVDSQFFMRRDDCGGAADNPHLSLEDAAEDVDCGYTDAMLNDVYAETGAVDPMIYYPATDGIPLTLDATRPITGVITIRNWNGAGAGQVDIEITLVGESGGEEKAIGTFTTTLTAVPTMGETVEYEIEPAAELNGLVFDTLSLNYFSHGAAVGMAGMIEHDEPPSLINVPSLVKK